jgi:hypothetical protein
MSAEQVRRELGLPPAEAAPPLRIGRKDEAVAPKRTLPGILERISNRGMKLGPEDTLSAEVYDFMLDAVERGSYAGIFTHCAHESGAASSKLAKLRSMKRKRMGMVPGAADWWFMWPGGSGVIELKAPGTRDGGLSPTQRQFRDWCKASGIAWALANKLVEVERTLVEWGALKL